MFNVGGPEILVILVVALVILGPDQLPKAMRTFGNVMAEIRKVSGGFQAEMRKAMDTIEVNASDAEKPQSGMGPAAASTSSEGTSATMPDQADVTEVVARNPALSPAVRADSPEPVRSRAAVDPADRAAG